MTEDKNKFINLKGANSTMKLGFAIYAAMVISFVLGGCFCYAAGDPISTVNKLSEFIFSLIRAIGLILLGLGIMQVGLSLKSHDPSQRANGFLTVAGGVVITFTKEILNMIKNDIFIPYHEHLISLLFFMRNKRGTFKKD